jgi:hypothetical protein
MEPKWMGRWETLKIDSYNGIIFLKFSQNFPQRDKEMVSVFTGSTSPFPETS